MGVGHLLCALFYLRTQTTLGPQPLPRLGDGAFRSFVLFPVNPSKALSSKQDPWRGRQRMGTALGYFTEVTGKVEPGVGV